MVCKTGAFQKNYLAKCEMYVAPIVTPTNNNNSTNTTATVTFANSLGLKILAAFALLLVR
jgi:hypothetical protein